ncbi:phage tail tape measure protein [Nocardia sp. NPDC055165]
MNLAAATDDLARDTGRAFGRIADDARRQLQRSWDQSATDMRTSFQAGAGQTWNNIGDDARRSFSRSWDQSADDLRQAMQRGAQQASQSSADDMRRDFGRAWDRSADDLREALRRAANQAGGDMRDAMGDAGQGAGEAGGEAAASGLAESLGGKAGVIGAALSTVFSVAGFSAGGLLAKGVMQGMEREQELDLTQARLGVDDATMRTIGAAASRAYADAFGESVGDNLDTARMAIQAGLLDPNATAQSVQQVISQLSGLNDFMGGDMQETAKGAGNLLKNNLAGSAEEAFDVLAAGYRAVGLQGDDLIDSVKEYSAGWKQTGLDGKTAMALIAQSIDLGSDSTDRAADALREFGRRMYEEGDTIKETLVGLKLPADELFGKLKGGGPDAVAAFDQIFDAIRQIEDPMEKAAATQALLGDTAGDFIGVFSSWDPSAAVTKLGDVSGAAQGVIDTMGGNAATSIESAKRSIEMSTDEISMALAQAFGPELQKVATWVSEHQPEILGFMGKLAEAALVGGDAMLAMASAVLRGMSMMGQATAGIIEQVVEPLGMVATVVGKLTGSDDLESFGQAMQDLDDKFAGFSAAATSMADGIDNTVRPGLDSMREGIATNIAEATQAEMVTRALGDAVYALPNEHTITITENSPAVIAELSKVGIKVQEIPGTKDFKLLAETAEGQNAIDAFLNRNTNRKVTLQAEVTLSARVANGDLVVSQASPWATKQADGGILSFANGKLPSDALIMPGRGDGLVQWAEKDAGPWEAFIPGAESKRSRSIPIWYETGRRLGVLDSYADGGIAGQRAVSWAKGRDGLPYIYGSQDCSWYQSGIYNQLTGKNTRFTTDSDFASFGFVRGSDPTGFTIGTNGGVGEGGHMVGDLFGTNVESDGTNGVQYGRSADGPETMPQQWYLPRDLWSPPATDDTSLGGSGGASTSPGGGSGGAAGGGTASGGGAAGGGGGGGGSAGGGGGTYNGQEVPAGVTPVWIVGSGTGTTSTLQETSPTTADTSDTASSSSSSSTGTSDVQTLEEAWNTGVGRFGDVGTSFLDGQIDDALGTVGLSRSGGAIQTLVSTIYDKVTAAMASELAKQNVNQSSAISQFGGSR